MAEELHPPKSPVVQRSSASPVVHLEEDEASSRSMPQLLPRTVLLKMQKEDRKRVTPRRLKNAPGETTRRVGLHNLHIMDSHSRYEEPAIEDFSSVNSNVPRDSTEPNRRQIDRSNSENTLNDASVNRDPPRSYLTSAQAEDWPTQMTSVSSEHVEASPTQMTSVSSEHVEDSSVQMTSVSSEHVEGVPALQEDEPIQGDQPGGSKKGRLPRAERRKLRRMNSEPCRLWRRKMKRKNLCKELTF